MKGEGELRGERERENAYLQGKRAGEVERARNCGGRKEMMEGRRAEGQNH